MLHLIAFAALTIAAAADPAPAAPTTTPKSAAAPAAGAPASTTTAPSHASATPPIPRAELILVDDRRPDAKADDKIAVPKGQAPAALVDKAIADIGARTGVTVARLSEAAQKLDAPNRATLASCNAAPCLALFGKKLGADVVVTVRLQPQEKVLLLTVARITALANIPNADDSELARTDAEALTVLADALAKIFPAAKK